METGSQNGAKMGVEKRREIGRRKQLLQDVQIVRQAQRVRFMEEIGDETVNHGREFHRVSLEQSGADGIPDDGESPGASNDWERNVVCGEKHGIDKRVRRGNQHASRDGELEL